MVSNGPSVLKVISGLGKTERAQRERGGRKVAEGNNTTNELLN